MILETENLGAGSAEAFNRRSRELQNALKITYALGLIKVRFPPDAVTIRVFGLGSERIVLEIESNPDRLCKTHRGRQLGRGNCVFRIEAGNLRLNTFPEYVPAVGAGYYHLVLQIEVLPPRREA